MNPEERIAQLEMMLAEKDRAILAMAEALRAANLRLQQEGSAAQLLLERKEAARLKKQRQRALRGSGVGDGQQDVSRDSGPVLSQGLSRDNEGTSLPPPLEGSPPPSDPSSPSPISSPPSFSSPPASPRNELRLEPQQAPRKRAQKSPKPEKATDPRHAPLVKALVVVGFPFDGGKDAKHVEGLLALADQQPATTGPAAPGEVLRRARIAWDQFPSFNSARTISDFRAHWGRFQQPDVGRGPAPPSDFEKPREYVQPAWLDPNFGKE